MGWWEYDTAVDTYVKNTTGTVVAGSRYFDNQYLHIPNGVNRGCENIAGPWQLPPDLVKDQCDQLDTCNGFTIQNNLSSGFLCQFTDGGCKGACDVHLKLPVIGSATKPIAAQ